MYLKTLVLHGFKSFPNRTVMTFEKGTTVIVGPNGSGKSNISDAMRWVLGELSSRNIRGTKMEDVIFGGTDDRRPMGFAEVSVTFDNTDPDSRLGSDFDEVTVTRRYYRTGESEYLINKEPKRLRDIYELFMNTGVGREGYSIIGQGKIAEIISKKSDDRRTIFEEAAGISKYRHRKEESERKLQATNDNLDRVKDILGELEGRVGPLEKEAERARKGLALFEEKKRADVSLWLYDTEKIRTDIKTAEDAFRLSAHELEIYDQLLSDLDIRSEALYEKAQENKLHSESLLNQIRDATDRLHKIDNEIRVAENEFAHSAEMIGQAESRITELDRNSADLEKQIVLQEEKKKELNAEQKKLSDERLEYLAKVQELTAAVTAAKKELEEALDELTVEDNTVTDLRVRIDVLEKSKLTEGSKSKGIEAEILRYENEGKELKAEADRCEANAAGFKAKIAEQEEIISDSAEKLEALGQKKQELSDAVATLHLERDAKIQRADVLQRMNDHFEGYAESVKFVMREYESGRLNGAGKIHGPLSSLIRVSSEYITAIESSLGSSLQNIVVDDDATAKAAIRALKEADAGRATFYPISAIRPSSETDEIRKAASMQGYVGRADQLVDSDAVYRSIVEWLLLRTVVFDTLDHAAEAAKKLQYKVKLVTLDGQIINAGGAFTGGSSKRDSGILSRAATIASLREEAKKIAAKLQTSEKELVSLNASITDLSDRSKDAEQQRDLLLTLSRSQFAALDNANAQYEANRNIIDRLKNDYDSLVGEGSRADEEIRSLTVDLQAAVERSEALRAHRAKRSAEMGVLDEQRDEFSSKANDLYIRVVECTKDIENVDGTVASLRERIAGFAAEKEAQRSRIEELTERRRGMEEKRGDNRKNSNVIGGELEKLQRERAAVESGSDEFDRALADIRRQIKEKTASREVAYESSLRNESKLAALREKQDKLGSQLWDDYEITYQDAVALNYPSVTAENRSQIAQEQTALRGKLRALGNYNPAAIEEYAEVKMRYDSLKTQYTDLTASHEELIAIIARLEVEMRESFVTAFEKINHHFGITFRDLFGGGSAELSLTDPEDVLMSGIEIKAAPPGKIIKSLSLLSGGEQSFVAIALLFAILRVNPTPFCILDEIEAALDEVNVFRFGEYIRQFGDGTQFILITHRRGTMEIGQRLYGITMPQRGISQAIELNVNEIEGKQKELLDGVL